MTSPNVPSHRVMCAASDVHEVRTLAAMAKLRMFAVCCFRRSRTQDIDGDGKADNVAMVDEDGDGVVDSIHIDVDGDGKADKICNVVANVARVRRLYGCYLRVSITLCLSFLLWPSLAALIACCCGD